MGLHDPDRFDAARLRRYLVAIRDPHGVEHTVLSDGRHRIRIDLVGGSLASSAPITLRYHLAGFAAAEPKATALLRLLDLHRRGRFRPRLFPSERRIERWVALLRVKDALDAGAGQREIAEVFYGSSRVAAEWRGNSDSLRSRIRRLVREARDMASGGWRSLLKRSR